MKKIIPILSLFLFLISCNQQPQNNVTIQPNQPLDINVSANNIPGFSVNNFVKLLKVTKDPQSLQDAINSPGNDINNLDLNHDGQVDYLKVVEQNGSFQVIDDYSSNQSTVVATLTINQQNNTLSVAGNQAYCGDNYIRRLFTTFLCFSSTSILCISISLWILPTTLSYKNCY